MHNYIGGIFIANIDSTGRTTDTEEISRPSNWSWRNVSSGASLMSASEWNNFTNRINEFREYMSLSPYSFTTVRSGNTFYAYIFNEAIDAISSMTDVSVSSKKSGNTMYASDFNSLKNSLNSIS